MEAGTKVQWYRPTAIGDGSAFIIADSRGRLYRVGIQEKPQPHLARLTDVELDVDIASGLAAAGDAVYAVVRDSANDVILSYDATDLSVGQEWPLTGRVTWGPEAVGDAVLVATNSDGLLCFEPDHKQRWSAALAYGDLAGLPMSVEDDLVLASVRGVVWRVSGADGRELAKTDLGQPLGRGAVPFGSRLLLGGGDGTLLVIPSL
jgi:hypothetical protein